MSTCQPDECEDSADQTEEGTGQEERGNPGVARHQNLSPIRAPIQISAIRSENGQVREGDGE